MTATFPDEPESPKQRLRRLLRESADLNTIKYKPLAVWKMKDISDVGKEDWQTKIFIPSQHQAKLIALDLDYIDAHKNKNPTPKPTKVKSVGRLNAFLKLILLGRFIKKLYHNL